MARAFRREMAVEVAVVLTVLWMHAALDLLWYGQVT